MLSCLTFTLGLLSSLAFILGLLSFLAEKELQLLIKDHFYLSRNYEHQSQKSTAALRRDLKQKLMRDPEMSRASTYSMPISPSEKLQTTGQTRGSMTNKLIPPPWEECLQNVKNMWQRIQTDQWSVANRKNSTEIKRNRCRVYEKLHEVVNQIKSSGHFVLPCHSFAACQACLSVSIQFKGIFIEINRTNFNLILIMKALTKYAILSKIEHNSNNNIVYEEQ